MKKLPIKNKYVVVASWYDYEPIISMYPTLKAAKLEFKTIDKKYEPFIAKLVTPKAFID